MEYIKNRTIEYTNAIVRVHSPVLTDEERQKRRESFENATAKFMKAVLKDKQQ